jgi:Rap1a immunity proteins
MEAEVGASSGGGDPFAVRGAEAIRRTEPRTAAEYGCYDRRLWQSLGTGQRKSALVRGKSDTMKLVIAALPGAIALSLINGNATAATPAQLLESCQAVIKAAGATQNDTVEIPVAGLACWYYMAAVQNLSVVVDENGRHILGICAPRSTSVMQYVRIFARYAQRHPGQDTDNAAALAVNALLDAFPCGARGPS